MKDAAGGHDGLDDDRSDHAFPRPGSLVTDDEDVDVALLCFEFRVTLLSAWCRTTEVIRRPRDYRFSGRPLAGRGCQCHRETASKTFAAMVESPSNLTAVK
ncbi:hypothetical protein MRX96_038210 [Rhipicephalus microplus]